MTNKTQHIDELTLSRYVQNDPALGDKERIDIKRHLVVCKGCEDLYKEIEEFYKNVNSELMQNKTLGERHKKELMKHTTMPAVWTEPLSSIVPRKNVNVPARIWYFARKRPVVSSMSLFAVIAVLAFSLNMITKTFIDSNPSYFHIESKNLVIYNKSGEIIWKKPIDGGRFPSEEMNTSITKAVLLFDTNGDGVNEVVTIFSFLNEQPASKNAITVYNSKGEIVWRKQLGSPIRYGERQYPLDFRTQKMVVYNDGEIKRFLVLVLHTHSPSVIMSLDERGSIMGEYWNYGHFSDIALADIDNDGKNELVMTLLDDENNQAVTAAIDIKGIVGKKQSPFSSLADIEASDALKYFSYIVQNEPNGFTRNSFFKIERVGGNSVNVNYGPYSEWLFTVNFGKNLILNDILTTDSANEKYGVIGAKEEINKLKQEVKHWERVKPPA